MSDGPTIGGLITAFALTLILLKYITFHPGGKKETSGFTGEEMTKSERDKFETYQRHKVSYPGHTESMRQLEVAYEARERRWKET